MKRMYCLLHRGPPCILLRWVSYYIQQYNPNPLFPSASHLFTWEPLSYFNPFLSGRRKTDAINNPTGSTGWWVRCCRLGRGWMLAGWCVWAPVIFFFFLVFFLLHWSVVGKADPLTSPSSCSAASESSWAKEEGKAGIKRKAVLKGLGERTESVRETDLHTADRRTDMEGSTEEQYKEKLLWTVKREVGFSLTDSRASRWPITVFYHAIIYFKNHDKRCGINKLIFFRGHITLFTSHY